MICGGTARTITPPATIRPYTVAEVDEKPAGGVRPRTMAATAAIMPTPAIAGSPRILIGRSRSGCARRSLIADENMDRYMPM